MHHEEGRIQAGGKILGFLFPRNIIYMAREMPQWGKKRKINYSQLMFDKTPKQFNGGKNSILLPSSHMQIMKQESCLTPYRENNPKCIKDISVSIKMIKFGMPG